MRRQFKLLLGKGLRGGQMKVVIWSCRVFIQQRTDIYLPGTNPTNTPTHAYCIAYNTYAQLRMFYVFLHPCLYLVVFQVI